MNGTRLAVLTAAALAVGLASSCFAAGDVQRIYTRGDAPRTPALEDLPLKGSVTQYGITWTFREKARVGQFVNGDYYVVGRVTVATIDPKPLFGAEVPASELGGGENSGSAVRNGSMHNPPAQQEVGFDSGIREYFRAGVTARLPINMNPGDSLCSSISLTKSELIHFPYHPGEGHRCQEDTTGTKTVAILSCVSAPLPPDAFRPGDCDRKQKIYLARDLKRNLLPKLTPMGREPDIAGLAAIFQRPWFNPGFFGFEQPGENMPAYGQWVGQAVSNAGIMLCLDYKPEAKEKLLINFVQVGIDYWGMVKSGHPGWQGWGGHGSGRKFPIVFAGTMLGDNEMASPTKTFPKVEFGEDNQTMYGPCWTGARVVFAGHSGISTATGKPPRSQWGPYEHLPPAKWDAGNRTSEAYRRANSSCCWIGEALALRLMKLEKVWNHDAFFDYVDRWMYENDKPSRLEINKSFPDKNLTDDGKGWYHEGYTGEEFIKPLWDRYRRSVSASIDGWRGRRDSTSGGTSSGPKSNPW